MSCCKRLQNDWFGVSLSMSAWNLEVIFMEKKKLCITKNEIELQPGCFSQRNFLGIIVNSMLAVCNWFCISFMTRYQDNGIALDQTCFGWPPVTSHGQGGYTGSRTYTVAFRLPVPHLESYPDYMQPVPEMCATVCGSVTFDPVDLVCRLSPRAASISSSGAMWLVPMPDQMKNSQVLISLTHWWKHFFTLAGFTNMVRMRFGLF